MTLDWKPNQQTFETAITMRNGLSAEYSDDRLAGFVSYWQAEPFELTQGQWENKFATYLNALFLRRKSLSQSHSPKTNNHSMMSTFRRRFTCLSQKLRTLQHANR